MNALTADMLRWLASREVGYAEAIEAWHSHCPRLTIWEDAIADGLIRIERGVVRVTERGRVQLSDVDGRASGRFVLPADARPT